MSVELKLNEHCSLYELTHGPTYLVFKHQPSPEKTSLEAKLLIIQNQESLSTALATFFLALSKLLFGEPQGQICILYIDPYPVKRLEQFIYKDRILR